MAGTNFLLLFRKMVAVYSENPMKHLNTICWQKAKSFVVPPAAIMILEDDWITCKL
jgi:hypothetical protein